MVLLMPWSSALTRSCPTRVEGEFLLNLGTTGKHRNVEGVIPA